MQPNTYLCVSVGNDKVRFSIWMENEYLKLNLMSYITSLILWHILKYNKTWFYNWHMEILIITKLQDNIYAFNGYIYKSFILLCSKSNYFILMCPSLSFFCDLFHSSLLLASMLSFTHAAFLIYWHAFYCTCLHTLKAIFIYMKKRSTSIIISIQKTLKGISIFRH